MLHIPSVYDSIVPFLDAQSKLQLSAVSIKLRNLFLSKLPKIQKLQLEIHTERRLLERLKKRLYELKEKQSSFYFEILRFYETSTSPLIIVIRIIFDRLGFFNNLKQTRDKLSHEILLIQERCFLRSKNIDVLKRQLEKEQDFSLIFELFDGDKNYRSLPVIDTRYLLQSHDDLIISSEIMKSPIARGIDQEGRDFFALKTLDDEIKVFKRFDQGWSDVLNHTRYSHIKHTYSIMSALTFKGKKMGHYHFYSKLIKNILTSFQLDHDT
jgi:hypothetical protein